ncbi:MAG TPA: hypothetical protein VHP35_12650, partial [Terriglobia bacterium]|nr:hypothetical protein [Terriglobia bacterium]
PQRRQRTLDAVKRLLLRESQVQPLLVVIEDLHWIDSETQALLDSLIESLPTARLLLLVNYRPEYQHGWGSKTYYTQLRIDPLPPESAEELLQALLGSDSSLAPLKQLLIARTEGNPFFLEESIRTLVETKFLAGQRGSHRLEKALESTQVPATVQAVLAARIDRLSPDEKRLLQSAAVIGKDVRLGLLQAIADQSEEEISRGLIRLQAAEFLYETSLFPEVEYTFKHALTHEVAYGSLLQERRRTLHARIVETIERLYAGRLAEQVALLAHHAFRSELWEKAVTYLQEAGAKTASRSAFTGGVAYFQQALEALSHMPESHKKLEQAIDIRVNLGPALIAMKGFAAPEVVQTYTEAREMCERLGDTPQLFPVLWGLSRYHNFRGGLQVARELGGQLLTLAKRAQDPPLLLEAHHTLWATLFSLGEFTLAQDHYQQGMAIYDPQHHAQHASLYGGHDPGVCGLRHASQMLWLLGYPDQALQRSNEALALAQKLSQPSSLCFALYFSAWVEQHRGERQAAQEHIEQTIALATEQDFTRWLAHGSILQGWLLVEEGKGREGILQMRTGGAVQARERSYYAALLAEAHRKERQIEEGQTLVIGELERTEIIGERYYEAELHRVKGELLLAQSAAD